ncbi:MAG: DNA polymerase III subunit delta' [Anaerolineae bacterium]|nr:DNA polymerase III subunit delta' [Anaerolineae bacterium]
MWQIAGHDWVVNVLRASLATGKVSHAYLFSGPPGIGKRTLAVSLAQAVNCLGEDGPCNECEPCRRIREGIHPDVHLVTLHYQALLREEDDDEQKELRIDTIRSISQQAGLKPFEGKYKVFIIPDAELMTMQAANSLLKTLEEPPPHVVLILTTRDSRLLPPTIVSRCQVFGLRPVPAQVIERELLATCGLAAEQAKVLARMSGGRIAWAIDAARDQSGLEHRGQTLRQLAGLAMMGRFDRLEYAERLARHRGQIKDVLELWLSWWRDLLLIKGGCPESVGNVDMAPLLEQEALRYKLSDLMAFIDTIRHTQRQLERNVDARLALEVLMLDLPTRGN